MRALVLGDAPAALTGVAIWQGLTPAPFDLDSVTTLMIGRQGDFGYASAGGCCARHAARRGARRQPGLEGGRPSWTAWPRCPTRPSAAPPRLATRGFGRLLSVLSGRI